MALHHGGVIENRLRLICFKIGLNIGSKFLASNLSHTWTSWLAHRASSVSIISRCLLLRFYRTDKVGISRKDMSKKAHLVYRFLSFAGVLALLFGLQYLLTNSRRTCTSTSAKPYIYIRKKCLCWCQVERATNDITCVRTTQPMTDKRFSSSCSYTSH